MAKDYEVKATLKIVGWDNVPAKTKEEAIKFVEHRIDELFTFDAPLLNKYLEVTVEIDEGFEDD